MPVDPRVILLIALVALLVAAIVARRAGEHADRAAGRRPVAHVARRGPLGAVVDLVDQSVAAYVLRQRLGLSTRTRAERRVDAARAAQIAHAEEIRQHRTGGPPPAQPTHLVVAGHAGPVGQTGHVGQTGQAVQALPMRRSSTLTYELVVAAIAFLAVVGIVIAIAPGGTGTVLSATGMPGTSGDPRPTPTASPTPPQEPVAT
jgi:hypothetical protein